MWQGWVSGIGGLWLIVSAFILAGNSTGDLANDLITGIILLVLGLWAGVSRRSWQEWIVAVLGAWMIVAGFWFPASYGGNMANNIIVGILVVIAGLWSGFTSAVPKGQQQHQPA
ncbi:MAG: SPW repeat protein [Deltaproteobacteria bacterium]|nr:SPW repeat protein [Deltaproteobacteria bacterium]MBW2112725.1 SPW repeat protein [Deltaproteobacteria bacterium]